MSVSGRRAPTDGSSQDGASQTDAPAARAAVAATEVSEAASGRWGLWTRPIRRGGIVTDTQSIQTARSKRNV